MRPQPRARFSGNLRVTVRLAPELARKLAEAAARQNTTRAKLVRRLLARELQSASNKST